MAATFEKTWAFDLNRAYVPSSALDLTRYTMWYIAAVLTGNLGGLTLGLWTLYASSDSTTAGTDATDRWVLAGPYDGTKIVRGAAAAVHSWIVLQSPSINGNVWYMILSFNSAADSAIRVSFTKTAPTGGSTTVTPTATDQWWPYASTATTAADLAINAGTTDNSRFNIGLSDEGDWYTVGCKQVSGTPNLFFVFSGLANYKAGDLLPVYTRVEYNASGVNANTAVAGGIYDAGNSAYSKARMPDGAAPTTQAHCSVFGWVKTSSTTTNLISPTSLDTTDGTALDIPVWVSIGTHTSLTVRGRVPDLAVCPNTVATLVNGSVSPATGTPDSCRIGGFWIPVNAAINLA